MNGLDIAFLILLGLLVLLGVIKGMTRILIGIGALIAAFVLAAQFHGTLAAGLDWTDLPGGALRMLAYVMIFLGVMIAGGVVAFLMRKLLKAAMLSWADRLAGAALGFVAAALIAALMILPLVAYSRTGTRALQESALAPYVTVIADMANRWVPEELSESYRQKIESLRQYWNERWADQQSVDRQV